MRIVGHRGARGLAPENTIASLNKALGYKVDEIEIDLRVTKDGFVILHHDAAVTDPNGLQLLIKHHSYEELIKHKKDMITFEEALDCINRQVALYVEIKPGEPVQPIVQIFKQYLANGWLASDFKIASFSQNILLDLQAELPGIDTIVNEKWSGVRASRRARELNTKYISMNQRWLWSGYIQAVKHSGYHLYTYTLNDKKKARKWQQHGLYAVVTDYPDRFEQ